MLLFWYIDERMEVDEGEKEMHFLLARIGDRARGVYIEYESDGEVKVEYGL